MGKDAGQVTRDEHDETLNAKKVNIVSSATIYAKVNTAAGGGNTTVEQGTSPWVTSFKGNITLDDGSKIDTVNTVTDITNPVALKGNITIDSGSIALTSAPTLHAVVNTSAGGGNVTVQAVDLDIRDLTSASDSVTAVLGAGANYLGLATVDIGASKGVTFSGNVTLDDGSKIDTVNTLTDITNPIALKGNVTLDDGSKIDTVATVTAVTDITNPIALKGNITIDSGTVTLGASDGTDIGNVDVASNTAWSDPKTYIGLATVDIGASKGVTFSGNVTLDDGSVINTVNAVTDITNPVALKGNITIDSIATVTVDATGQGDVPITLDSEEVAISGIKGNVTIDSGTITAVTDITNPVALKGNVTLDDGSIINTVNTVTAVTDITNPIALKGNVTLDDGSKVALVGNVTIDSIPNQEYSYKYTSGPTTDWIVKGSAGFLHAIQVGAAVSSGVIEVSDHASDGDGAVKLYFAGDTIGPAVYPLNMTMGTGITLDVTTQTHVTVIYR